MEYYSGTNIIRANTIFGIDEKPLTFLNVSEYFRYFRVIYALSYEDHRNYNIDNFLKNKYDIVNNYKEQLLLNKTHNYSLLQRFNKIDLGENEIIILSINYDSPLMVWVKAMIVMLTTAVIISGGEVKISSSGDMEFRVPPISYGINEFKKVFPNDNPNISTNSATTEVIA